MPIARLLSGDDIRFVGLQKQTRHFVQGDTEWRHSERSEKSACNHLPVHSGRNTGASSSAPRLTECNCFKFSI